MKPESLMLLKTTMAILIFAYGCLLLRFFLERELKKRWLAALNKTDLLKLEDQLTDCLKTANIDPALHDSIEEVIRSQHFSIEERRFIPFREAYTIRGQKPGVFIKRSLPSNRRNFALTHELMHIIYKPEEIADRPAGRNIHSMFRLRDETEQERDYMAAGYLLQKESFWKELTEAHYFDITPGERKEFVYRSAQKYNVEPSMVFRRINELNVIMQ